MIWLYFVWKLYANMADERVCTSLHSYTDIVWKPIEFNDLWLVLVKINFCSNLFESICLSKGENIYAMLNISMCHGNKNIELECMTVHSSPLASYQWYQCCLEEIYSLFFKHQKPKLGVSVIHVTDVCGCVYATDLTTIKPVCKTSKLILLGLHLILQVHGCTGVIVVSKQLSWF